MKIMNVVFTSVPVKIEKQTTQSDKGILSNGDIVSSSTANSLVSSQGQPLKTVNSGEVTGTININITKTIVSNTGSGLSISDRSLINAGGTIYPNPNRLNLAPAAPQPVKAPNTVIKSRLSDTDKVILNAGGSIYTDFNKLRMQQLVFDNSTTPANSNQTGAKGVEVPAKQTVNFVQPSSNLIMLGGTEFPDSNKLQFRQLLIEPSKAEQPEKESEPFTYMFNRDSETPVADGSKEDDKLDGKFTSNVSEDQKNIPVKNEPPVRRGFFGEILHDPATCKDCKAKGKNTNVAGLEFILDQTVGTGPIAQIEKKTFLSLVLRSPSVR